MVKGITLFANRCHVTTSWGRGGQSGTQGSQLFSLTSLVRQTKDACRGRSHETLATPPRKLDASSSRRGPHGEYSLSGVQEAWLSKWEQFYRSCSAICKTMRRHLSWTSRLLSPAPRQGSIRLLTRSPSPTCTFLPRV